jgi:hypothetical protein
MVRQVVKSCLLVPIVGWKKRKCGLLLGLVLFSLVAPPLQPGVVGLYLVRGGLLLILLPFENRENRCKFF